MNDVRAALDRQAAVVLTGPRQVGKTTLALAIGETRPSLYLDMEDQEDRNRLSDPALFFERVEDRLVILDEIHRMPEIFQTLRGVIDKGRRAGKGKGRFLMLGSAALDLLRQSGETLAGRIAYVDMSPILVHEVDDTRTTRDRLWLRGGFPDPFLAASDAQSFALRTDFIRTYLARDVPQFGSRVPATTLQRFWTMLAHLQGSMLNASELARAIEVSSQTVARYVDLLCDLLLVRRLPPYHTNVGKRLVKSPRVYVRDSGLLHALIGIEDIVQLSGHPIIGASWEGFVIETLLAATPTTTTAHFYRTAAGAEIDLVLAHRDGTLWSIEIKRSLSAKLTKGARQALADLKPARAFVVHAGDDSFPIADNVEAVSIRALVMELQRLA